MSSGREHRGASHERSVAGRVVKADPAAMSPRVCFFIGFQFWLTA